MEKANWYAELTLKVIGPEEGPVTAQITYESTTKAMVTDLQNKLAGLGIELNSK